MNTGAAVVAFAVTLFLKLYECFHVYHTSWLWWSLPGDANMPVRLVTTSSFDHREFFLSRLVIIVVVIHCQYYDHDLYFHPIIPTLTHICCTSNVTFKRWPRSSASICSFDPQKNSHLKIKKWPKHVISKYAVRDISKDGSWSLSWIKELVFWTPFQKLPQSEMSVIASYRNFCSKRLGVLC